MRRLRRLAAAFALVAPASIIASVPPAASLPEDPVIFHARAGEKVVVDYPAGTVVGNEPSGIFYTPDDCADLPTCARIPIHVKYPENYDPDVDEYFITAVISWEQRPVEVRPPGSPAGQESVSAQGNDLDNYFWVVEQDPKDKKKKVYRDLGHAASAKQPERFRWFGGADEYIVVVSNYSGVNTGFRLELFHTPASIGDPFEDLGVPGFRGQDGSGGGNASEDFSAPLDFSDLQGPSYSLSGNESAPLFSTTSGEGPPLLGPDNFADTFGAFGGSTAEFENALEGGGKNIFKQARQVGPAKPVSGTVVAFWLGLVPIVLAVAAGVWFFRRRPTALSFSPPTPSPSPA